MATRDRPAGDAKDKETNTLCLTHLMSVLPQKVNRALLERLETRRRAGEPDQDFHQTSREAAQIEKSLLTEATLYSQRHGTKPIGPAAVLAVGLESEPEGPPSYDPLEPYDNSADEYDFGCLQMESRGRTGQTIPHGDRGRGFRGGYHPRIFRGQTRGYNPRGGYNSGPQRGGGQYNGGQYNSRPPPPTTSHAAPHARRVEDDPYSSYNNSYNSAESFPQDSFDTSQYDNSHISSTDDGDFSYDYEKNEAVVMLMKKGVASPIRLNVSRDDCLKCGLRGHRAFGPDAQKCPLRAYELTEDPCSYCDKGGHLARNCPNKNVRKNY
jgi:hypothetical protein